MPRITGLHAPRALNGAAGPPHVIVLTTFDADEHVVEALAAARTGSPQGHPAAADPRGDPRVADGDPMLSPSVTRTLIERIRDDSGDDRAEVAQRRSPS